MTAFGPGSWAATVRSAAPAPSSAESAPAAGALWAGATHLVDAASPDDVAALIPSTALASSASSAAEQASVGILAVAPAAPAAGPPAGRPPAGGPAAP